MKTTNQIKQWFLAGLSVLLGLNVVQADIADAVIQKIDNSDAQKVAIVGDWQTSTWTGGGAFYKGNYIHDKNAGKGSKKVRFTPVLTNGGFSVYVRYTSGANRADNVPIDIHHAGEVSTKTINQKQNGGKWIFLGSYEFTGDEAEFVEIRNDNTNGYVIADAVAFVELSSGAPCLPDLVSYWDFDQPDEVIIDQAGENTGWINGAVEASGIVNTCLQFDGNDSVLVADNESLRLVDAFTLGAWVKESLPSRYAKIVSRRDGDYFYFIGVDNGKPYAGVGDGDSYTTTSKTKTMPSNEWHHLAAVYRADTDSLKLFYDGNLIETVQVAENLPYTEGVALSIGSDEEGTEMFFTGAIDELAVFNAALPDDDIMTLYMKGLAGNSYCAESLCGNGVIDPGEDCDGGVNCPSNCRYGRCYATNVVSYMPGLRKDRTPILPERSNPGNALGAPQGTDTVNFVSLGFGGTLILGFDSRIINRAGNDFKITETSYNKPGCSTYPETAHVFGSKDGHTWEDLGAGCLDSEYDLGALDYAAFIKIVDESDPAAFGNSDEGFDVDGIEALFCGGRNSAPIANDDLAITEFGVPVVIHVLLNDSDADGDSLSIIEFTQPANGTVADSGNGAVIYTPQDGFEGADAFTYTVGDGKNGTDIANVAVTVIEPSSKPIVNLYAIHSVIEQGDETILKWNSSRAQNVTIDNGVGGVAMNSDMEPGYGKAVSPQVDTTYTITATGPGGTATDSVTVTVTPLPPTVDIFASGEAITPGKPVQLFWNSTHADFVEIDQGIGPVASNSNASDEDIIAYPQTVTTYTITATGPGGTVTDSVTLPVNTVLPPTINLTTSSDQITRGGQSWLYWSSTNADAVAIDQGIGVVAANGCYGGDDEGYAGVVSGECNEGKHVSPQTTTTYTITASGPGGTATDTVTVTVSPAPPTVDMITVPDAITAGKNAWLYWHSSGADTVVIDQNIGYVASNGCNGGQDDGFWSGAGSDCGPGILVSPQDTITYTITASGPGGTAVDSVTVTVSKPQPPTVEMIADPEMIETGGLTWLFWHSANADLVSISQDIGQVPANGCTRDDGTVVFPPETGDECGQGVPVSPSVTTIYRITSMGPGGIATQSVTVYVDEIPPPTVTIAAEPGIIEPGDYSWLSWGATNIDSVSIDQGIGNVFCDIGYGGYGGYGDCEDDIIVFPTVTTTYIITVTGPSGTATDSVTVYVDEVPPPTVTITADPEGIISGDISWLTWSATNAESVSIDQGIGNVTCDIGYGGYGGYGDCEDIVIVSPMVTTTYTITATGPGGTATDSVTIYVDEDPPPTVTITADPEGIVSGDISWLTWEASNVESVSINQGIGNVTCDIGYGGYGGYGDCEDTVTVSPAVTTTYTITATGPGGTATDSVTVYVDEDPPPTVTITAGSATIDPGDISWLTWSATNAESVSIDQGIGNVTCDIGYGGYGGYGDCEDMVIVSPTVTTTYTITVTGPGGTATAVVTVVVGDGSVPTATFFAEPTAIFQGGSTTLRWHTSNAETVEIDQGIGNVSLNSDETGLVVSPESTTTYILTATGPGGRGTISVTVIVLEPLTPLVDLMALPETVSYNQHATLAWASSSADTVFIGTDIGPDIGEVALNSDLFGLTVTPKTTTTYTITATGPGGTATDSVTIHVPPHIEISGYAQPITAGDSCILNITTINGETVSIDQGIGAVQMTPGSDYEFSGAVTVAPLEKTTYTITATGNGGTSTKTVTIDVAPDLEFHADPEIIESGAHANLHWTTLQADRVTITPDFGEVALASGPGGMAVSPERKTTYYLTAEGPTHARSSSVTIYVNDVSKPPAVTSFIASPPTINPGQTALLKWETVNMQAVRIDNGIGDVPMFGAFEVSPERTMTYTLTVIGPKGSVTKQATVHVRGTYEAGTFAALHEDTVPDGADALDAGRFSILTGRCVNPEGNPIPGVAVSVLGKAGFGEVFTDTQGLYSIPVKGNNRYTIVMKKEGLLSVHRKAEVVNNRITVVDMATLISPDADSTVIDFIGNPEAIRFHAGGYVTDGRGRRRVALTIPYSEAFDEPQIITSTEYPAQTSLPGSLPPNASHAFAAEIDLDQENEVGTALGEPAIAWVNNFLNFSVGRKVPVGWYDREKGVWVPKQNGWVVRLLDTNGDGFVDGLDVTGDSQADDLDGDGVTSDETDGLLSGEVEAGATYYRFSVDHTGPWGLSWPYAPMNAPAPAPDAAYYDLISEENVLADQDIAIPGTEFFLHYSEARTSGYHPAVTIPVTGETVPNGVESVLVRMIVAGRVFEKTLLPVPSQTVQFQWDGRDYLGHEMVGSTFADIEIGYAYGRNYAAPGAFTHAFSQSGNGDTGIVCREKYIAWSKDKLEIDRMTQSDDFIADGWTLSAQHLTMNSGPAVLYLGDGRLLSMDNGLTLKDIFACGGHFLYNSFLGDYYGEYGNASGIAVDDDTGEVFISDGNFDVIWSVLADYGFNPEEDDYIPVSFAGDYTRRSENLLNNPAGITANETGVYYAESGKNVVRKGVPGGNKYGLFAGNGVKGYSGNGQNAIGASFASPSRVQLDHWGNLYILDNDNHVIRKVSTDGVVETIAGNGTQGSNGDGGPALAAAISPTDLAVDTQGNIYIAEPLYYKIRKIDVSGAISTVAGTGAQGSTGVGGPALSAELYEPENIAVSDIGTLYIGDNNRLFELSNNAALTRKKRLGDNRIGVMATDMQGRVFFSDQIDKDVYKLSRPDFKDMADGEFYPFADSNGRSYYFSGRGKHLYTGSPSSPMYAFEYNTDNLLVDVLDAGGNTLLAINRDETGKVLSLESSAGVTALSIDERKHLTGLVTPTGGSASMGYSDEGLLVNYTSTFSSGGIKGVVTDSAAGSALEGVTVNLISKAGTATCQTAADGSYDLSGLEPGEYTLEFLHSGFFKTAITCKVVVGECHLTRNVIMQEFSFPPEVISVKVDPPAIKSNDSFTLSWETANADVVEIWTSSWFSSHVPNGSRTFLNTRYGYDLFIRAFGPGGESGIYRTAIEVFVEGDPPPWGKIAVMPSVISAGESATVSWDSRYADIVKINNIEETSAGSMSVSPRETTTYELFVKNNTTGKMDTYETTLTVTGPGVEIQASPETISPGESTTLTWKGYNVNTVSIDNGIGQVDLEGSMTVFPAETTTYTATAMDGDGNTVTDNVTVEVGGSGGLQITSPINGSSIFRPDVMVQGTFINASGKETGITVNGVLALTHGDQFVANHVPLQAGENTLTVTATDMDGDTQTASVDVTADLEGDYVRMLALPESGVSPLETTLKIDGSFSIEGSSISGQVPGEVNIVRTAADEYKVNMTTPGIYYFTAEVEKNGLAYTDTTAVSVMDKALLDAKLKLVFAGIKTALAAGDIDTAVSVFSTRSREKYREIFERLSDSLQQIASDMGDIEMIYVHEDVAKYRIRRPREIDGVMVDITYYIYFRVDVDGLWRIEQL